MAIKLILPFPVSANRYWRHDRGHTHRSTEAIKYIEHVRWLCLEANLTPLAGNISISFDFFRPAKRGDLDNLLKVTIDSLKGLAYEDDKQIVELYAARHEGKTDPRVEVLIEAIA